ncbi:arrestin [Xylaria arbuscula]|nr:arrestin [Xylaria arbuscula]
MPSFNPFGAHGKSSCSLFEIRLDNDFVVFRGSEHEASGQLLKGVVVLCLKESLKVEDVHLRLQGHCRIAWLDGRQTPTGIHNQKVDRTTSVLKHQWKPFELETNSHGVMQPGNYEWPFEIMLPGDTAESVEGLYQTGITYLFKATVSRGKLAKNLHAFKRLRIIRTLEPAALELNHAMSVENVWPNKVEYSVSIPQKAVVFGSSVPLEMRFTPLLKGLEMGVVSIKMFETQEFTVCGTGHPIRTHKHDREVASWNLEVTRENHWQDIIEESGQEGWVVNQDLPLPKRLNKCVQDCTVQGIKIRHKLKLTVALNNPDGHVSELRATLPIAIFISPNMPLDDEGNLVATSPGATEAAVDETRNMAPPGYGQHILDQLYDDVDLSGLITPGLHSGIATPFYAQSRAGSSENLTSLAYGIGVTPAALSSRLQSVSLEAGQDRSFLLPRNDPGSGAITPYHHHDQYDSTGHSSHHSPELSRRTSEEEHVGHSGHQTPPLHTEFPDMEQLSKVPSYTTATKTHLPRTPSYSGSLALPDYNTAMSAPSSPSHVIADPMETITEGSRNLTPNSELPRARRASNEDDNHVHGFSFFPSHPGHIAIGGFTGERRLRLSQHRGTS